MYKRVKLGFYRKLYIFFPSGRYCEWIAERRDGLAGFRRHKCVGEFWDEGCKQNVLNGFKLQALDSVAAKVFRLLAKFNAIEVLAIDGWLG